MCFFRFANPRLLKRRGGSMEMINMVESYHGVISELRDEAEEKAKKK
jgi:hypothetical protein